MGTNTPFPFGTVAVPTQHLKARRVIVLAKKNVNVVTFALPSQFSTMFVAVTVHVVNGQETNVGFIAAWAGTGWGIAAIRSQDLDALGLTFLGLAELTVTIQSIPPAFARTKVDVGTRLVASLTVIITRDGTSIILGMPLSEFLKVPLMALYAPPVLAIWCSSAVVKLRYGLKWLFAVGVGALFKLHLAIPPVRRIARCIPNNKRN